jgi:hypothetical protein
LGQFVLCVRLVPLNVREENGSITTCDTRHKFAFLSVCQASRPALCIPSVRRPCPPVLLYGWIAPVFLYALREPFRTIEQRRTRQIPLPDGTPTLNPVSFPLEKFSAAGSQIRSTHRQEPSSRSHAEKKPPLKKHPASETSHRSAHSCPGIFPSSLPTKKKDETVNLSAGSTVGKDTPQ